MSETNVNSVSEGADKQVDSNQVAGNVVNQNNADAIELQKKIDAQNEYIKSLEASQKAKPKVSDNQEVQIDPIINSNYQIQQAVQNALKAEKEAEALAEAKKDLNVKDSYALSGLMADGKTLEEAMVIIKGDNGSAPEPKAVNVNTNPKPVSAGNATDGVQRTPVETAIWIAENRGRRTYVKKT